MEKIWKGFPVAKKVYKTVKEEIDLMQDTPHLVIIQVGNDPASEFYVSNIQSKSKKVGIKVTLILENETISTNELKQHILRLNLDNTVHGIMVQKPLPLHIDNSEINKSIHPQKDVDGFHPTNLGNILLEEDSMIPSTPAAVIETAIYYGLSFGGKHVVILGRSTIVGKPLANLLLQKKDAANATVTICHSRTENVSDFTQKADILVAAIGKANYVKEEMIKKNSIILDVGVNLIKSGNEEQKYVGDVDYNSCFDKALAITPVPGGIGSVTTALLLQNVLKAYKNEKK
jgi:methylenetetrahydrofolate dehydrogenase (NADP+) / methenyltetrahydrofolate cyclohydrolase